MNIFPIDAKKDSFLPAESQHKKEEALKYTIFLPNNWWNSMISFQYNADNALAEKRTNLIEHSRTSGRNSFGNLKNSHSHWSVTKGDYRVKEVYKKDYAYYRELKNKILKYSFFPFLFIAIYVIYLISKIISTLYL